MSLPVEPKSSKYPSRVWGRKLGREEERRGEAGHIWECSCGKTASSGPAFPVAYEDAKVCRGAEF